MAPFMILGQVLGGGVPSQCLKLLLILGVSHANRAAGARSRIL